MNLLTKAESLEISKNILFENSEIKNVETDIGQAPNEWNKTIISGNNYLAIREGIIDSLRTISIRSGHLYVYENSLKGLNFSLKGLNLLEVGGGIDYERSEILIYKDVPLYEVFLVFNKNSYTLLTSESAVKSLEKYPPSVLKNLEYLWLVRKNGNAVFEGEFKK